MKKAKYSGECELKTRAAYLQGCNFPTMLRIQEICCKSKPNGEYPIKCFVNCDYYIMDDEQCLERELDERYDCLGEVNVHFLCHIVQTIPLYVSSRPLRERVYKFGEVVSEISEIEGEYTIDNNNRFIQGELAFVLKEDCLTVGVVVACSDDCNMCQLWVIGPEGKCVKDQVSVSRVLKYRDMLEHINVNIAYKLKKQLFNLAGDIDDTDYPIWLGWRFIETNSQTEEFGMQVYTLPIPNNHASKILCREVELSEDGWHYRIAGDDGGAERMLWGYMDKSIVFGKTIHPIERIIHEGFPIGFDWRIRRLVSGDVSTLKTQTILHSKR